MTACRRRHFFYSQMPRILFTIVLSLSFDSVALAALDPPARVPTQDSTAVLYERGVELARLSEFASTRQRLFSGLNVTGMARWKTEWQTPEGETDRIKQDGRWYTGVQRRLSRPFGFWGAASGEHFDDRPKSTASLSSSPDGQTVFMPQAATSVHILRGGGGASLYPWKPLTVDVGIGGVQDQRLSRIEGGFGFWSRADLEHWELAGYDQSLALQYNMETPLHHENSDLIARYENFREFYPGNTNRAEASASVLSRDISLAAAGQLSRRTDQKFAVRDALTYSLQNGVRVEMSGDIVSENTEQELSGETTSSLKENQAGFSTAFIAGDAKRSGTFSIGLRSVTQTIRGEILQGKKTDLGMQGRLALPWRSKLTLRVAVAKYSLDTPNTENYDDRDELRYTTEASWSRPLFQTLNYELHGVARLDHLVYLFRQSSANNRWARFFLAGSTIRHRPNAWFEQTLRVNVSANYQDYDYETDPRTARSTVFRRLTIGDTLSFYLLPRLQLSSHIGYQIEEFGRLFWDSFEEERSDETRSSNVALEMAYRIMPALEAGAGGLWEQRRGRRFPDDSRASEEIFLDLQTYGPMAFVEYAPGDGVFFSVHTRVLRQLQLDRDDRWLTLGEAIGGFRW